jgi:nucleotidyltransferase/DNA polymerase involved in DNA repair
MAFVGDKVYPCGLAAARETDNCYNVEEEFYDKLCSGDPQTQQLCRICLSNRKNKIEHQTGLTAEFGIYDSPISKIISFKNKGKGIRKIYRKIAAL